MFREARLTSISFICMLLSTVMQASQSHEVAVTLRALATLSEQACAMMGQAEPAVADPVILRKGPGVDTFIQRQGADDIWTKSVGSAKKAIVIGASSGMGREVAKRLSKKGYALGLVARRLPLLESLQKELVGPSCIKQIDVTHMNARARLCQLISQMQGTDMIVISISSSLDNRISASSDGQEYDVQYGWTEKSRILNVCAKGFIAMADVALEFFIKQNSGHLVGISSTSGLRGNASSPEYSAAKACISYYMEGIRNLMVRDNIDVQVTDVVPGFVAVEHSPLGEDPDAYWEIPVQQAGQEIIKGIERKQKVVYVPSKVWLLALVLKYLPDCLYQRFLNWM